MSKQQDLFRENPDDEKKEIKTLSEKLLRYQHEYYVLARPSVSDREYDLMFDRLAYLEKIYPELALENSPTQRVGSDLTSELPEVRHTIPVLSLDKAYTTTEILKWVEKISKNTSTGTVISVEEKIDGISIVLYYENGMLRRAVTRGNGDTGNDVTANVKTIGSVPLLLSEPVTVAVRGEIYLPLDKFSRINQTMETMYANPRNLAAGTIRRIKSSDVSRIPLNIFVYEGFFSGMDFRNHHEILVKLEELGFRINRNTGFFSDDEKSLSDIGKHFRTGKLNDIDEYIREKTEDRKSLGYEIDGLVIKINNIQEREKLGYTGHHPRWAIAYKFESSEAESVVKSIDIQIGRTGRVTPVARIEPVEISGSVVSNVTLHNQDYIDFLNLAAGDRVTVSRRGDVIPAVENVTEKNNDGNAVWKMPSRCPFCNHQLSRDGAHLFCVNSECPERIRGRIIFFCSKDQMDIENLGFETINLLVREGIVKNVNDLYEKDFGILESYDGFGPKKIELIRKGIEESRKKPFRTVLSSIGLPEIGPKVCELLISSGLDSLEKILDTAERRDIDFLLSIHGIGLKTAESFIRNFNDPETRETLMRLGKSGLNMMEEISDSTSLDSSFKGQSWCVTGSFSLFRPRSIAEDEIRKRGGSVTGQVSGNTTHLLAGQSPGSKYDKALKLGIKIVDEKTFSEMIGMDNG